MSNISNKKEKKINIFFDDFYIMLLYKSKFY